MKSRKARRRSTIADEVTLYISSLNLRALSLLLNTDHVTSSPLIFSLIELFAGDQLPRMAQRLSLSLLLALHAWLHHQEPKNGTVMITVSAMSTWTPSN